MKDRQIDIKTNAQKDRLSNNVHAVLAAIVDEHHNEGPHMQKEKNNSKHDFQIILNVS